MNQSLEKPVEVACFACGKTQRVRPSKITRCDAYLCNNHRCVPLMPEPLEGFVREFRHNAAGGFAGYVFRAATEHEREAARRAKDYAAGVLEFPRADFFSKQELRNRGWTGWLFKRLLSQPDVVLPDPARPQKLGQFYHRDRVERAETTREWQRVQEEALARKEWEARWRRRCQGELLGPEEWMDCSHPEGMLVFLKRRGLRNVRADALLVCALARELLCSVHGDLLDEELRVAERHAEGLAGYDEYMAAYGDALTKLDEEDEDNADEDDDGCWEWGHDACCSPGGVLHLTFEEPLSDGRLVDAADWGNAAHLVREVYGNPFAPVSFDESWRTRDVVALAKSVHDGRCFDRMPELAAALEQAGCNNEAVLDHCRQSEEHAFGCWVLSGILLGK